MDKKFFVECEQACPECGGQKRVHNPQWVALADFLKKWDEENPQLGQGRNERRWQAECLWWKQTHGIEVGEEGAGLPWDEAPCDACEGRGILRSRVPLEEALGELARQRREAWAQEETETQERRRQERAH